MAAFLFRNSRVRICFQLLKAAPPPWFMVPFLQTKVILIREDFELQDIS